MACTQALHMFLWYQTCRKEFYMYGHQKYDAHLREYWSVNIGEPLPILKARLQRDT